MDNGPFRLDAKKPATSAASQKKPSGSGFSVRDLPSGEVPETRHWHNGNAEVSWNVGGNGIAVKRKDRGKTLVYNLKLRHPDDKITNVVLGKNIQVTYTRSGGPGMRDKEMMDIIGMKTNPETRAECPGFIEREKLLTLEVEEVQKPEKQTAEPARELSNVETIAAMLPGIRFSEAVDTLSLEDKQKVEKLVAAQPENGFKLATVQISIRDHGAKELELEAASKLPTEIGLFSSVEYFQLEHTIAFKRAIEKLDDANFEGLKFCFTFYQGSCPHKHEKAAAIEEETERRNEKNGIKTPSETNKGRLGAGRRGNDLEDLPSPFSMMQKFLDSLDDDSKK